MWIYLNAIACVHLTIFEHICIIDAFKGENLDAWLQVNHGVFGLGGLGGPLLVYFFETKSYILIGVLALVVAPPFFKI